MSHQLKISWESRDDFKKKCESWISLKWVMGCIYFQNFQSECQMMSCLRFSLGQMFFLCIHRILIYINIDDPITEVSVCI